MTAPLGTASDAGIITADPAAWDAAVLANGGHLLQSWRWGAFKERFGWRVARIAAQGDDGMALAQVLYRGKAGVTIGYVPRGPVLSPRGEQASAILWARIDEWARRRRALTVILEPDCELPADMGERNPGAWS